MAHSILSQTSNLIRLFLHTRGEDEVPPQFYLWAFLTTMAACVRDKVYVKLLADSPVYPNLYTLLYGPSGCGKGTAIEACTRLVTDFPRVGLYEGAINGPSLFKHLHQVKRRKDELGQPIGSKVFLAMEELAMDVGNEKEAAQFVKYIVGLWKPKPGLTEKTTVSSGHYILEDRCINFLGGTTRQWIFQALSVQDMKAGGGRRIVVISGQIDPAVRVARPKPPYDYKMVQEYVHERLELLTRLEGEIQKTPEAQAWEDHWYETRPSFTKEEDGTTWRQEPELMNKIAIGLVLADGGDLVMKPEHLHQGLKLAQEAQQGLPKVMEHAKSLDSPLLAEVWCTVRDHPGLNWGQLVRQTGMLSSRLQGLLSTLRQSGRIFTAKGGDGSTFFFANEMFQPTNSKTDYGAAPIEPPPDDDAD